MNKQDMVVRVDSREKDRIPFSLNFFKKYNTSVQELETGDYVFSNGKEDVCFEYKTIKDFIGSVSDGRIFEQVKRMREDFKWSFVVLDGTIEDLNYENRRRRFHKGTGRPFTLNQFYGVIARLNCYVTVVQCHNQAQAFNYMEKQACKIFDDVSLSKHFKNVSDNPVVNFLTAINGVNIKTAKLLVDEYNIESLHDLIVIVNAVDLTLINGIGKVTAEKITKKITGDDL